ncbi:hypothetical protein [Streptomyces sp. NBC_00893]|uniref:hypothetical protein n=1 Tax=Streptomyces sp. NBC_00893 TaxID=2975862 RepID=UPI0022513035|nr:hypothetical protein [Streptomyces sp. NBC_00893]MCX4851256.1 hypothetical protein [Streptomyces sp. NBC_00893]
MRGWDADAEQVSAGADAPRHAAARPVAEPLYAEEREADATADDPAALARTW